VTSTISALFARCACARFASVSNIYTDGAYLQKHPAWHVEDSAWKALQVIKILHRNRIVPETIADIGCGAGEIIRRMSQAFPHAQCQGFDISSQALQLARSREAKNLTFQLAAGTEVTGRFDVVLLLDVIEHVEDCFGFLRSFRGKAKYLIAHFPLDLSLLSLLLGTPMASRRSDGHLHYFTKETAFALLSDTGYEIQDWFYPQAEHFWPRKGRTRLVALSRAAGAAVAPSLTSLILGGASVMVLAH
jgi:SAM-dependent methyltransferase